MVCCPRLITAACSSMYLRSLSLICSGVGWDDCTSWEGGFGAACVSTLAWARSLHRTCLGTSAGHTGLVQSLDLSFRRRGAI